MSAIDGKVIAQRIIGELKTRPGGWRAKGGVDIRE